MDTLININRGMTKLSVHACIPPSKRQTINGDAYSNILFKRKQTKSNFTRVCLPRSKRQRNNGDACKLKQTKNKSTCACLPRSKRQTSNGDAYSNARRRKTNLHLHVYLVSLASDEQSDEQCRRLQT